MWPVSEVFGEVNVVFKQKRFSFYKLILNGLKKSETLKLKPFRWINLTSLKLFFKLRFQSITSCIPTHHRLSEYSLWQPYFGGAFSNIKTMFVIKIHVGYYSHFSFKPRFSINIFSYYMFNKINTWKNPRKS